MTTPTEQIYKAAEAAVELSKSLEALGNAGLESKSNVKRLWEFINSRIDTLELALQETEHLIQQALGEELPQPEPGEDPIITDPQPERIITSKDELIWPAGVDPNHYLGALTGDMDPAHNRPLPSGLRWKDTGDLLFPITAGDVNQGPGPYKGEPVPTPPVNDTPVSVRTPIVFDESDDPDWVSSQWLSEVENFVREDARAENGTSVFILYDAPDRDNGNYSAGGVVSLEQYRQVVTAVSLGIDTDEAIVILEPDALGLLDGLPVDRRKLRIDCLALANQILRSNVNTRVYTDASMWIHPQEMAGRLQAVGATGFAINTSGWEALDNCYAYGNELAQLSGLPYVIDSSRCGNGNPHKPAWCNVTDTKIGPNPTTKTGSRYCDALLWAKIPGESDGLKINGYDGDGQPNRTDIPRAGEEWPEFQYAIVTGDWNDFKRKYNV